MERDPAVRFSERRSRRRRVCEGCQGWIEPGGVYLRHVTFPSDGVWGTIGTLAECADCAERYGRLS